MTNSRSLPFEFNHLYDSIIRHVWAHDELPNDVSELTTWLESAGLDLIVDSWVEDELVVNLKIISNECFDDAELMQERSIRAVSDTDRINFGLERINRYIDSNDGYIIPSVHCIKVTGNNEQSVVLGYLLEIHGQEGSIPTFMGFYKNNDDFLEFLKVADYWPVSKLGDFSENTILRLWKK